MDAQRPPESKLRGPRVLPDLPLGASRIGDGTIRTVTSVGQRSLDSGGAKYDLAAHQAEVERIDSHVRRLRVPLYFSGQLYDLRGHIDLVRSRIAERPPQEVRIAAE